MKILIVHLLFFDEHDVNYKSYRLHFSNCIIATIGLETSSETVSYSLRVTIKVRICTFESDSISQMRMHFQRAENWVEQSTSLKLRLSLIPQLNQAKLLD